MANKDAAFGLNPISSINGSSLENLQITGYLASGIADAYVGMPVKILAAGANTAAVTGFAGGTFKIGQLPAVDVAAAGDAVDYVITGFVFDASTEDTATYRGATGAERVITMVPLAGVICEVQSAETGAFSVANVNATADLVGVSGSTTSGYSTMELATTYGATGQFKILGVSFDEDNSDATSANVNLLVTANETNWYGNGTGV